MPQPLRHRLDLRVDVARRVTCGSNVAFKRQAHQLSALAHGRHCQERVYIRCLLERHADAHSNFGPDFVWLVHEENIPETQMVIGEPTTLARAGKSLPQPSSVAHRRKWRWETAHEAC